MQQRIFLVGLGLLALGLSAAVAQKNKTSAFGDDSDGDYTGYSSSKGAVGIVVAERRRQNFFATEFVASPIVVVGER